MTIIFEMAIKKSVKTCRCFDFTKVLLKPNLKRSTSLSNKNKPDFFSVKVIT